MNGEDKMKERRKSIDLLRSFAIILMIMGHVGFVAPFYKWIHAFHIPVWFVISGYFCNTEKQLLSYSAHKFKTLIVPYFVFSVLYEIIWTFVLRMPSQWLGIVFPNTVQVPLNGALWFLPAFFICEMACFITLKFIPYPLSYILLLGVAGIQTLFRVSLPLATDSALVGCGFFLLGVLIKKYKYSIENAKSYQGVVILIISSVFVFFNKSVNMKDNDYGNGMLFWLNALLLIVGLWIVFDSLEKVKITKCMSFFFEIGSESIIYVCTNQFLLFFIRKVIHDTELILPLRLVTRTLETIIIILICFILNRLIRNTRLRVVIGR